MTECYYPTTEHDGGDQKTMSTQTATISGTAEVACDE